MKSIHFTAEEITAILKGEKTQCRKVIKPQPINNYHKESILAFDKKYNIGEVIYCKEPWNNCMADIVTYNTVDNDAWWTLWSPAITMPEWASRCKIRITEIRAERLQDNIWYWIYTFEVVSNEKI